MPALDMNVFLVIALSAIATYSLRLGGLLLSSYFPKKGRFKVFLEALPASILMALIAPGILAAGFLGAVAALSCALITYKTNNVFLAMVVGVVIVALGRNVGA